MRRVDGAWPGRAAASSVCEGDPRTLVRVSEPDQIVSAPEEDAPVGWGLGDAVIGFLIGLVCSQITAEIAFAASDTPRTQPDDLPLSWLAFAQLGLWVGLIGVPYVAARLKGNGMVRDFGLRVTGRDVGLGAFCGLVGQFAIVWLVYIPMSWFTDVTTEEISEPARDMTDRAAGPVGVILLVLIVGIGAPIVEEIFWRGLVQRSLVRRVGVVWGIGIASVLFGAAHFQLIQLPALAVAGALFGVLAHRAGRLGPAIAAHMVFNMTAVVALLAES
jgi:membrane protease YdiL (CAAX protease family)